MNNAASLYKEGYKYYAGKDGYPLNYRMAADLWKQSADLGLPEGYIGLAIICENGLIDEPDFEKAAEYYHQAYYANPDHSTAIYNMARIYANGSGVPKDDTKALSFLKVYFEKNETSDRDRYCNACYFMGKILFAQNDIAGAIPYLSIAAEKVVHAKYMIGSLSYHGHAKGKYYQDPFSCFKEAAEAGYVNAMHDLGVMYNKNNLPDKACYWLDKAAKNGHKEAAELSKKIKKLMRWSSYF